MQRLQFFLADAHSGVSITWIHTVAGALPEIRGRAGQHIDRIPLVFQQQLGIRSIGLERNNARCVDAVIIVQRVLLAAMRRVELLPKAFFFEIRIQRGTAADCLFLCRRTFHHTTARICRRSKVVDADFLPGIGIRHCCFQRAFGTHNDFGRPSIGDCLLLCAFDAFRIQLLFFSALFDGVEQRTVLFAQSKGILENLDVFLPSHNSNLFSLGNLIMVSIPFWMYYPSAEVHRACRLAGPVAGVSPACIVQSGTQQRPPIIWYQVILSLKALFIHIIAI